VAGIRIGQVLVQQGILSDTQVEHILTVQRENHRPFGDLAERLYGIHPNTIEEAWIHQYIRMVGVTDLNEQEIDINCLRLLNRRQAWQFQLLPLHHDEQDLHIATTPDRLVKAVNFVNRLIDEPVYLVLAERKQLHRFLMKHYPIPNFLAEFAEAM
jgi:hypothetical protein